jgi:hypothetical protein
MLSIHIMIEDGLKVAPRIQGVPNAHMTYPKDAPLLFIEHWSCGTVVDLPWLFLPDDAIFFLSVLVLTRRTYPEIKKQGGD